MIQRIPQTGELEPIEQASRDELRAVQLQRLKWSLRHAYNNVAHYRRSFDAAGVHPDDLKDLSDLSKFPFFIQERSARKLSVWPLRSAT